MQQIVETIREDYAEKIELGQATEGQIVWVIPLFRFALYTGMRSSEITRLRWKHIDHKQRLIYIYEQKNEKQQTIPLNRKAADVLQDVEQGEPDAFVFNSPKGDPYERSIDCFKQ